MECCNIIRGSALLPQRPSSSSALSDSQFLTNFKLPRLRRQNPNKQRLLIRNACNFDPNELPFLPGKYFKEEAIGAEYGEGFETFRPDGPLKVDVADTRALKLNAWKQLASEEGKEIPEDAGTQRLMLYSGPDHVLNKVLQWEKSETDVYLLKMRLSHLYYENLLKLDRPLEGVEEWLEAVSTARIPCAIVSNLDRRIMVEALDRMGIKKYFQAIVSEEDGMEAMAHRFLSAAVKLDRKPSKCIVFEDDPRGVTAAHNCTMMAVALIGAHPAYDLVQADLAVANFSELSVINLRRLFAHKGSNFMDLQKQIIEKSPPKRKLTTDTIF
uniref:Haloacid dehalogenase-like hydrolase superfamily protein n=1 Tax=Chenopodium quinoa TaxID=63459 RepID=A0A803NBW3_CHEQI